MSSNKYINFLVFCSVFILLFNSIYGYRILIVYPAPSYSHQQVQQAVSKGLVSNGHELIIITPNPLNEFKNHPNVTQIDASFIYEHFKMANFVQTDTPREFMRALQDIYPPAIDQILSMPEVQALILNKQKYQFDAIICENLGFTTPFFVFAELHNASLIGLGSLQMLTNYYSALGNIWHPILHSENFVPVPSDPNFFDRLKAVYDNMITYYWAEFEYAPAFDWIIKKHFKIDKTSNELIKRIDLAIESVPSIAGYARPLLPNVIQIGFLHVRPPIPLPSEFEIFLSNSKHGVIYCSFGTNVKSDLLDIDLVQIMLSVFGTSKYDILWKYDGELESEHKNIKIVNWVPQQDILAHPYVKLFITQGGAQSRDEAFVRGVPLLVIPFFADQIDTGIKLTELGIATILYPNEITSELLGSRINEMTENKKYMERSKELARLAIDVPMSPVQTAVWWIEYTIRNKNIPQFKYKNLPRYQYFLLDIIGFHLVILIFIVFVTYKIVKKCQESKVISQHRKTSQKKNKFKKRQ